MKTIQPSHPDGGPPVRLGFDRFNIGQLSCHFLLAVLIGVSLRLTTFVEATTIAVAIGDHYKIKTSFLVSFGFTKAFSNLAVGRVSDIYGRKAPHAVGWMFGIVLGVVLLLLSRSLNTSDEEGGSGWMFWYVLANICLGAQQGWTWTTNIFMFLDILGPKHRALASSLSNSVGYISAAATTYMAATLSTESAFRLVLSTSVVGWIVATFLVRDTSRFVEEEMCQSSYSPSIETDSAAHSADEEWNDDSTSPGDNMEDPSRGVSYDLVSNKPSKFDMTMDHIPGDVNEGEIDSGVTSSFATIFADTCWRNKSAAILCVGGLMTNLVTSLAWGLVLIWGKQQGLSEISLANVGSAFTFSKGFVMVLSGYVSDRQQDRKRVLVAGFLVTMIGLGVTAIADLTADLDAIYVRLLLGGVVIGCGIGSVYCVMTAALSDHTSPQDRASAIGVYKFWRDSGYAFGGLLTGWMADVSGGSFVVTTFTVAVLVGALVIGIALQYEEVPIPRARTAKT
jgi:MFS family permease